jgi:transposase InsO family protein
MKTPELPLVEVAKALGKSCGVTVVCRMSRRGNCYDDAVMESVFSTVKSELGDQVASNGDAKMELSSVRVS